MLNKIISIDNKYGIHARPSSAISEIVNRYHSHVIIKYKEKEADASSIMNLILLCVEPGAKIEIIADGIDEQKVLDELVEYLEVSLYEEEKNK